MKILWFFALEWNQVDFSMIEVPNYGIDWHKPCRFLLKIHNFSDFVANEQFMINCLSFETIPRMPAQFDWEWQTNKDHFIQDALQKKLIFAQKGQFFPCFADFKQSGPQYWDLAWKFENFSSNSFQVIKVYNESVRSKENVQ